MRVYYYLILSLLFLGCGGSHNPAPAAYPNWYLNPPSNNSYTLYGVGEGNTLESAKTSALNAIASSISLTLSSELKKSESSQSFNGNENVSRQLQNTIKAQVKSIEFNDYKVSQNALLADKLLVLIEVDRAKLFYQQKAKLDRLQTSHLDQIKRIETQGDLMRSFLYETQQNTIRQINSSALLCKSINAAFNPDPFLRHESDLKDRLQQSRQATRIKVIASNDAQVFVPPIKEALNKAGITTVNTDANTFIHLKNSFLLDEIYGFKIAKSKLVISTEDRHSNNIATRTHSVNGKSRYDYDQAKKGAAASLNKKIQEEGVFTFLGMQQ